jgi:hypothetical protein
LGNNILDAGETGKLIKHGERIPITLAMTEARPKFSNERTLDLVMNAPHKRIEEIIVKGMEDQPKGEIGLATGLSVDVDMKIREGKKAGRDDIV